MQVAKSPQALAVYGAAAGLGAVFLPLNTAYTAAEVAYFLGNATPRVFLCDPTKAVALARWRQAWRRADDAGWCGAGILCRGDGGGGRRVRPVDRGPDDLAAILYTSGTTGRSKGAMLTHRNLLSNAEALADLWRFTAADVLLHALPIFHTHGLFVASNVSLLTGGRMIFLPGFDLDQVLAALPRATAMMGVPTFYTRLLEDARFTRDLCGGMRLFVSGSAPLLAETHRAFQARTGHVILERYGMTETNMNTSNPYEGERRAGTVGFPLPGVDLRIMAEGAPVAPGEAGVIEVRGPNVFAGYWQMPEKTAEELRPDGWFITGDVGRVDADGYVQIVGRAKDLVISGGFNVYPVEVEAELDAQPGVLESAVIGVPHPDLARRSLRSWWREGGDAEAGGRAGGAEGQAGAVQAAEGGGGGGGAAAQHHGQGAEGRVAQDLRGLVRAVKQLRGCRRKAFSVRQAWRGMVGRAGMGASPQTPGVFVKRQCGGQAGVSVAALSGESSVSRKRSKASRSTGSNWPKPCIQTEAARRASGSSLHQITRPRFSRLIRPASVRVWRCLEMAARLTWKGSATSVTAMSSSRSMVRMARRVGSARAAKTVSSVGRGGGAMARLSKAAGDCQPAG